MSFGFPHTWPLPVSDLERPHWNLLWPPTYTTRTFLTKISASKVQVYVIMWVRVNGRTTRFFCLQVECVFLVGVFVGDYGNMWHHPGIIMWPYITGHCISPNGSAQQQLTMPMVLHSYLRTNNNATKMISFSSECDSNTMCCLLYNTRGWKTTWYPRHNVSRVQSVFTQLQGLVNNDDSSTSSWWETTITSTVLDRYIFVCIAAEKRDDFLGQWMQYTFCIFTYISVALALTMDTFQR